MPRIKVVTDSTSDLPPELARELGVMAVPIHVHFGDEAFLDGVDLTSEEFYSRLRGGGPLPKTSAPSPDAFRRAFESLAPDASGIVCVTVSRRFSGTYNSALQAAQQLHLPPVRVVDSGSVSMGLGFGVMDAARAASEGASLEEVEAAARSVAERTSIVAYIDTLEFLQRSGRIGRAARLVGSILEIKPVVTIIAGEITPLRRARTKRKAIGALVEWFERLRDPEHVAIIWSTEPGDLEMLREMLASHYTTDRILVSTYGPAIGVHVGPGAMGLIVVEGRDGA